MSEPKAKYETSRTPKFIKIGNTYAALHYDTNTVFIVCDEPASYKAQVIQSEREIENMESYNTAVEITVELFQEKFSAVVSKLHNDTPYA